MLHSEADRYVVSPGPGILLLRSSIPGSTSSGKKEVTPVMRSLEEALSALSLPALSTLLEQHLLAWAPSGAESNVDAYVRTQVALREACARLDPPITQLTLGPGERRRILILYTPKQSCLDDARAKGSTSEEGRVERSSRPKRTEMALSFRLDHWEWRGRKDGRFADLLGGKEAVPVRELRLWAHLYPSSLELSQKNVHFGEVSALLLPSGEEPHSRTHEDSEEGLILMPKDGGKSGPMEKEGQESSRGESGLKTRTVLIRNRMEIPLVYELRLSGSVGSGDLRVLKGQRGLVRGFGEGEAVVALRPTLSGAFSEVLDIHNVLNAQGGGGSVVVRATIRRPQHLAVEPTEAVVMDWMGQGSLGDSEKDPPGSSNQEVSGYVGGTLTLRNMDPQHHRIFVVDPGPLVPWGKNRGSWRVITDAPGMDGEVRKLNGNVVLGGGEGEAGGGKEAGGIMEAGLVMSEEVEERLEGLQQKAKIARRKGNEDKVRKLEERMGRLRLGLSEEEEEEERNGVDGSSDLEGLRKDDDSLEARDVRRGKSVTSVKGLSGGETGIVIGIRSMSYVRVLLYLEWVKITPTAQGEEEEDYDQFEGEDEEEIEGEVRVYEQKNKDTAIRVPWVVGMDVDLEEVVRLQLLKEGKKEDLTKIQQDYVEKETQIQGKKEGLDLSMSRGVDGIGTGKDGSKPGMEHPTIPSKPPLIHCTPRSLFIGVYSPGDVKFYLTLSIPNDTEAGETRYVAGCRRISQASSTTEEGKEEEEEEDGNLQTGAFNLDGKGTLSFQRLTFTVRSMHPGSHTHVLWVRQDEGKVRVVGVVRYLIVPGGQGILMTHKDVGEAPLLQQQPGGTSQEVRFGECVVQEGGEVIRRSLSMSLHPCLSQEGICNIGVRSNVAQVRVDLSEEEGGHFTCQGDENRLVPILLEEPTVRGVERTLIEGMSGPSKGLIHAREIVGGLRLECVFPPQPITAVEAPGWEWDEEVTQACSTLPREWTQVREVYMHADVLRVNEKSEEKGALGQV